MRTTSKPLRRWRRSCVGRNRRVRTGGIDAGSCRGNAKTRHDAGDAWEGHASRRPNLLPADLFPQKARRPKPTGKCWSGLEGKL